MMLMIGIGFLEASALDGTNVEEAFHRCARQILTKVELGTPPHPYPPKPHFYYGVNVSRRDRPIESAFRNPIRRHTNLLQSTLSLRNKSRHNSFQCKWPCKGENKTWSHRGTQAT